MYIPSFKNALLLKKKKDYTSSEPSSRDPLFVGIVSSLDIVWWFLKG